MVVKQALNHDYRRTLRPQSSRGPGRDRRTNKHQATERTDENDEDRDAGGRTKRQTQGRTDGRGVVVVGLRCGGTEKAPVGNDLARQLHAEHRYGAVFSSPRELPPKFPLPLLLTKCASHASTASQVFHPLLAGATGSCLCDRALVEI